MNVNDRNNLFSNGNIDRDDLWPKITEFQSQAITFRFSFGLDKLPCEPGVIIIRGPRQYGKSTWLEFALLDTLEEFGKGSAFFLNGDDIIDAKDLVFENVKIDQGQETVMNIYNGIALNFEGIEDVSNGHVKISGPLSKEIFFKASSIKDEQIKCSDKIRSRNIEIGPNDSSAQQPSRRGSAAGVSYVYFGTSRPDCCTCLQRRSLGACPSVLQI